MCLRPYARSRWSLAGENWMDVRQCAARICRISREFNQGSIEEAAEETGDKQLQAAATQVQLVFCVQGLKGCWSH